ncbi:MAG: hypothetical protein FWD15_00905 [Alphaproteobacteria bacterium]|nr:hypothetical protein [Alphaproteobacteria bacterium]
MRYVDKSSGLAQEKCAHCIYCLQATDDFDDYHCYHDTFAKQLPSMNEKTPPLSTQKRNTAFGTKNMPKNNIDGSADSCKGFRQSPVDIKIRSRPYTLNGGAASINMQTRDANSWDAIQYRKSRGMREMW